MAETEFSRISEHVYWLSPGKPDRPALAAVVGEDFTVMLDAGASAAHVRLMLDGLRDAGVALPRYTVLTHWHWDHIFGAKEISAPLIAHVQTAEWLAKLTTQDWSNNALDQRSGHSAEFAYSINDIKLELPEPRRVDIIQPEMVFEGSLDLYLGGVSCHIQHVGGDHAADSVIIYVEPDRVLFLGDALYQTVYSPIQYFTAKKLLPLMETLQSFEADHYIEGHGDAVMSRMEFATLLSKMRLAMTVAAQGLDEAATLAAAQALSGIVPDEDTEFFVQTMIAGRDVS